MTKQLVIYQQSNKRRLKLVQVLAESMDMFISHPCLPWANNAVHEYLIVGEAQIFICVLAPFMYSSVSDECVPGI